MGDFNKDYEAVAASTTATLGETGTKGDVLENLIVAVDTADATSKVTIADGDGAAIIVIPESAPIGTYSIVIGARCVNETTPGWKVVTLAGATVLATGRFR